MRVDRAKLYEAADLFMDAAFADQGLVPALEVLTEALGATSGVIIPLTSRAPGPAPATQSAEDLMTIYMKDGWYKNDLRMAGFQDMIRRGVTTDQDIFPLEVMQRAPYYQEFLRKANMLWFMGLGLKIGDEIWAAALQRSPAQGAFLPEEQTMALSVMDRVSRGASIAAEYHLAKIRGVTSFHDSFRQPILQLNRSGEVIDLNAPAEALMGRGISVVNKQLIVSKPDSDRVAEFVSALVSFQDPVPHIARQSISVRRLHGRPLILSGQRLSVGSAWDYFSQSRAIITINDPDMRVEPDMRILANVFGLTPSEAKVAAAFYRFEGDTTSVANDTGLAYLSVKSYLKSIFAKMGVQSQTQMLLLISRLFERSPQFGG